MATSIRLDPEVDKEIAELAAKTNRSKSFYIKEMIRIGMPEVLSYYRHEMIKDEMRRNPSKPTTIEEIAKEFGIDLDEE